MGRGAVAGQERPIEQLEARRREDFLAPMPSAHSAASTRTAPSASLAALTVGVVVEAGRGSPTGAREHRGHRAAAQMPDRHLAARHRHRRRRAAGRARAPCRPGRGRCCAPCARGGGIGDASKAGPNLIEKRTCPRIGPARGARLRTEGAKAPIPPGAVTKAPRPPWVDFIGSPPRRRPRGRRGSPPPGLSAAMAGAPAEQRE